MHPRRLDAKRPPSRNTERPRRRIPPTHGAQERKLLSTPHFESTARWAIDKGSLPVWRPKVKEIARRHGCGTNLFSLARSRDCKPSHYRAMSRPGCDARRDFFVSSGTTWAQRVRVPPNQVQLRTTVTAIVENLWITRSWHSGRSANHENIPATSPATPYQTGPSTRLSSTDRA